MMMISTFVWFWRERWWLEEDTVPSTIAFPRSLVLFLWAFLEREEEVEIDAVAAVLVLLRDVEAEVEAFWEEDFNKFDIESEWVRKDLL